MIKRSLALATVLVLGASAAIAQVNSPTPTNRSSTDAPGGTNGAAPTRDVGTNPNVATQPPSATTSSSMTQQKNKKDSATGAPASGYNTKP